MVSPEEANRQTFSRITDDGIHMTQDVVTRTSIPNEHPEVLSNSSTYPMPTNLINNFENMPKYNVYNK
jgi:hypothetical protein